MSKPLGVSQPLTGPDVSSPSLSWQQGSFPAGSWVINEVGSIHQSFTDTEPCVLLVRVYAELSL